MRVSEHVNFRTLRRLQKKCGIFMFMQKDSLKTVSLKQGACDTEAPGTHSQCPTDPRVNDDHIVQRVTDGHKAVIGHHC